MSVSMCIKRLCLIGGIGAALLMYLLFAWRAADLDAQVGMLDEELGKARFELLQARRGLVSVLSPSALAPDSQASIEPTAYSPQELVPCPALPPVEPSALAEATGRGNTKAAPARLVGGPPATPARMAGVR